MRILPRVNDEVNEEWISDKTRHVVDGLRTQRLDQPYIRENGRLYPASWQDAFDAIAAQVKQADPKRMGVALDSIVAGGSIISGGRVKRSVVGYDVRINSYSELENSILFNHVNVGRHAHIRNAIIDRHVTIPERAEIGYDLEADRQRYHVAETGVVVVVREESMIEEPE